MVVDLVARMKPNLSTRARMEGHRFCVVAARVGFVRWWAMVK